MKQVKVTGEFDLSIEQKLKRFDKLSGDRGTWLDHWQEVSEYVLPNREDINQTTEPGRKLSTLLLDNTAVHSNELLASFLHSLLTNPNAQWFEMTTGSEELDARDDVRRWLQDTTLLMHNTLNNSNFQTEVHELYLDLGAIGTGCMLALEDRESIVRFSTKHIKNYCVAEDSKGQISEVYRSFEWNVHQIVEEFGAEVVEKSQKLMDSYKSGSKHQKTFEIVHVVYPRKVGPSVKSFTFDSQYILKCEKMELKKGGFRRSPYMTPRWSKRSGEVYGRSPGMTALPEAKMLNAMVKTTLKGAQKTVDPPLQLPDDGFMMPLDMSPAGINYYRPGTDRIEAILNDARIDFGFQAVSNRQEKVRDSFFVNQLQLNQGPQMTATEVLQRTEEASRLFGPMLGRQQSEFLRPLIERVYEILEKRGDIPEVPESLQGRRVDARYNSLIAKSQRLAEGQAILRTFEAAAPFLQLNPEAADNFNVDEVVKSLARIYGFPQRALHDQVEVDETREARAQAQQAQLEAEQAAAQAENDQKNAQALASASQAV